MAIATIFGTVDMPRSAEQVFAIAFPALAAAVDGMAASVPAPRFQHTASGHRAFRYQERSIEQALVLKSVRLYSALLAGLTLLSVRLVLDVGAVMRILDELGEDIRFLSGPAISKTPPEARHDQFLAELFQEEFDDADPLKSSQKRNRVSRQNIRAYGARVFHSGFDVSKVVEVTRTIGDMNSGFVHGASVHTMEAFDGENFRIPSSETDNKFTAMRELFPAYLHRGIMDVGMAAHAIGAHDAGRSLYEVQLDLFDPYGDIR